MTSSLNMCFRMPISNTWQRAFYSKTKNTIVRFFKCLEVGLDTQPNAIYLTFPQDGLVFRRFEDERKWKHINLPPNELILMLSNKKSFNFLAGTKTKHYDLIYKEKLPLQNPLVLQLVDLAAKTQKNKALIQKLEEQSENVEGEMNKLCDQIIMDCEGICYL